jgi:hypothetical protein
VFSDPVTRCFSIVSDCAKTTGAELTAEQAARKRMLNRIKLDNSWVDKVSVFILFSFGKIRFAKYERS